MSIKFNPLVPYGFDKVGDSTGSTPPSTGVDVVAKIKEEIARDSGTMSYSFANTYKDVLDVSFFSCRKIFGYCHCDIYLSVTKSFTFKNQSCLVYLDDPGINTYHNHVMQVMVYRYSKYWYFPAHGTDGVYIHLNGEDTFDFKPYDIINISNSFNYIPK